MLVHHVHREQWRIIYPGLRGQLGWWIESWLAPRLYRRQRYVTVSESSKADLVALGVSADRIAVIRNGIDVPHPSRLRPRSSHAADLRARPAGAAQAGRARAAGAGRVALRSCRNSGWTSSVPAGGAPELTRLAAELGVSEQVVFHGHVSEHERDALLDASWLMLAPSIKEGWGIAIMEAAARGVPTIAYAAAGGVTESVLDGETGLLVADYPELLEQTRRLLADHEARLSMGKAARERAENFDWASSAAAFERHLGGGTDQRLP